jgi:RNA processing factor Prp31
MSGLEVIGAISAVIAILDSSIKVYDSAQKDLKLSETFNTVRSRLPVLLETLKTCASALQPVEDSLPVDVCEALETILTRCDETAGKLRQIFEKVLPGKADTRQERYVKIVKRLGKGNKVEELMVCITEDIQLVVNHHAVKSTGPEQTRALEAIIKEMRSVQSSLPEEEDRGMTFNSEGGALTNYFVKDNGQQIINHAAVNTQNFGKN